MRAGLSALGIAIGVAAIVAVLGLSSSSQAGLLSEIERLGTNLLTVTNGQSFAGKTAELPLVAPAMIARIDPVENVAETGNVKGNVYRSPLIPTVETNALSVQAASLGLLHTLGIDRRAGPLPERRHRPGARRGARLRRRATARDRPPLPRRADLGRKPVALPRRDPRPIGARTRNRKLGARRLQGRGTLPAVQRAPQHRLPARPEQPGRGRPVGARRDREPRSTQRSQRQPTLRHAHSTRRRPRRLQRSLPRTRRRRPAGRRRRRREHHGHLRAGTPLRDRAAPRARRDPRARSAPSSSPRRSCSRSAAAPSASPPGRSRPRSTPPPRAGRSSSPPSPGQAGSAPRS